MKNRTAKTYRISRSFIACLSRSLALATLGAMGLGEAKAVDYNWDPGQTGGTFGGGAGTWNLTDTSWFNAVSGLDEVWGNTIADKAIFGNTAGIVSINTGTGVVVNGLTFNSSGYTLAGASLGDVLSLQGATPTITVGNAAHTATISTSITGTSGLTLAGAGTLALTGIICLQEAHPSIAAVSR